MNFSLVSVIKFSKLVFFLHTFWPKCILLHIFGKKIPQISVYYLVFVKIIESTSYGAYLISCDPNKPGKYKYPPNDPFLESRHSKVFSKMHDEVFDVVIFSHNSLQNSYFFYYFFPPHKIVIVIGYFSHMACVYHKWHPKIHSATPPEYGDTTY